MYTATREQTYQFNPCNGTLHTRKLSNPANHSVSWWWWTILMRRTESCDLNSRVDMTFERVQKSWNEVLLLKELVHSTKRSECCFYTRSLQSATSCSSGSTQWRILWTVRTAQHCSASEWCRKKCSNRNTFSESVHPSFRGMTFDLTNCYLYFNSVASLSIPSRWI